MHYWVDENPRVVRRTLIQQRFAITVWAGIIGNQLIGPIVLPNSLNAAGYVNLLENTLGEILEDVPLHRRRNIYISSKTGKVDWLRGSHILASKVS